MKQTKQMFILPKDKDKLKQVLDNNHFADSVDNILGKFEACEDNYTYHIDIDYHGGGKDSFSTIYPPQTYMRFNELDTDVNEPNTGEETLGYHLIRVDDVIYFIHGSIVDNITVNKVPF